jgi:alpha-glucosidase
MYVVYQNHLPMMADYPEAYRDPPGLEFLIQVSANWDETRVPHAQLGECLVVARRSGETWYLGGMAAARPQELDLPLDFLGKGSYEVALYLDDPDGGPTSLMRRKVSVSATETLRVVIPSAGGFAARLVKAER